MEADDIIKLYGIIKALSWESLGKFGKPFKFRPEYMMAFSLVMDNSGSIVGPSEMKPIEEGLREKYNFKNVLTLASRDKLVKNRPIEEDGRNHLRETRLTELGMGYYLHFKRLMVRSSLIFEDKGSLTSSAAKLDGYIDQKSKCAPLEIPSFQSVSRSSLDAFIKECVEREVALLEPAKVATLKSDKLEIFVARDAPLADLAAVLTGSPS